MDQRVVFGLDIGTGSLGLAIRQGNEIAYSSVDLFAEDFASTQKAAQKRRMWRTRLAHRARELWLNEQCKRVGIPVLKELKRDTNGNILVNPASLDSRLKREFPSRSEEVVYTSCLLRIMILEGKISEMEDWQIYKALHSAIQKRGYGVVAWAKRPGNEKRKEEDEKKLELAVGKFWDEVKRMSDDPSHHFACYLRAQKMGLWYPQKGITNIRQDHNAIPFGIVTDDGKYLGLVVPRQVVEEELRRLLLEVKKRYPDLDTDYVLYGPARKRFDRLEDLSQKERIEYERSWNGLLSQKIPRFDNRILAQCALMPRFHVCNASEGLAKDFHFLSALHRLRVVEKVTGEIRPLRHTELVKIYTSAKSLEEFEKKYGLTKTNLKKLLAAQDLGSDGITVEIPPAKPSGRARFSRPALYFLKNFYLRGQTPGDFLQWCLDQPCTSKGKISVRDNREPLKGLTKTDFRWLELCVGRSWNTFSIPDLGSSAIEGAGDREQAIREALAQLNNPLVRHRIQFVQQRVKEAQDWIGEHLGKPEPDKIVIEFIRDAFIPEKRKREMAHAMKENEKVYKRALEDMKDFSGKNLIKKRILAERQNWIQLVPRTGEDVGKTFQQTDLPNLDIAHIIPQNIGGPSAMWNLFLLPADLNHEQGERTPYEWLQGDKSRWAIFADNVKKTQFSKKTKKLLLGPDARDYVQKLNHLAETAWIARVVRRLLQIHFGWPMTFEGMEKRIHVVPGGLTAKVRRKYGLNELIGENEDVKNRKNKKHHALDAMVICYLSEWYGNLDTKDFFKFPKDMNPKEVFRKRLEQVYPQEIGRDKPILEENFYGVRTYQGKRIVTKKSTLRDLAYRMELGRESFSVKDLKKRVQTIWDGNEQKGIRAEIEKLIPKLESAENPEELWKTFFLNFTHPSSGTRVRRITLMDNQLADGETGEYRFLNPPEAKVRQVLKPKSPHAGQYVYRTIGTRGETFKVRPLYVHELRRDVEDRLKSQGQIIDFFRSGDLVEIQQDIENLCAKGVYKLNTIKINGWVEFSTMEGVKLKGKGIGTLVQRGFRKLQVNGRH